MLSKTPIDDAVTTKPSFSPCGVKNNAPASFSQLKWQLPIINSPSLNDIG